VRDVSGTLVEFESGFQPENYWRLTKNTETDISRVLAHTFVISQFRTTRATDATVSSRTWLVINYREH